MAKPNDQIPMRLRNHHSPRFVGSTLREIRLGHLLLLNSLLSRATLCRTSPSFRHIPRTIRLCQQVLLQISTSNHFLHLHRLRPILNRALWPHCRKVVILNGERPDDTLNTRSLSTWEARMACRFYRLKPHRYRTEGARRRGSHSGLSKLARTEMLQIQRERAQYKNLPSGFPVGSQKKPL